MKQRRNIILCISVCAFLALITLLFFYRYPLLLRYCTQIDSPLPRAECLIPYFTHLTESNSPKYALDTALAFQREGVIDDCHVVAHAVGARNLRVHEGDPGMAFATCAMGCIDGCYHGVMEEYIRTKPESEVQSDAILHLCDSVPEEGYQRRQCLHGVGHGLLRHSDGALAEAVGTCARFPDTTSRDTCLGGVFMQNTSNMLEGTDEDVLQNLSSACTPVEDEPYIHSICTEAFGPGLMFYTGHNLERTIALCNRLDASLRAQCIDHATMEQELHESILGE